MTKEIVTLSKLWKTLFNIAFLMRCTRSLNGQPVTFNLTTIQLSVVIQLLKLAVLQKSECVPKLVLSGIPQEALHKTAAMPQSY